jgi:hypothetical protein
VEGVALSEASEEVVEYWLNVVRGFFTIRGLKVGNREIDSWLLNLMVMILFSEAEHMWKLMYQLTLLASAITS